MFSIASGNSTSQGAESDVIAESLMRTPARASGRAGDVGPVMTGVLTLHHSIKPFIIAGLASAGIIGATACAAPFATQVLPTINAFVTVYAVMMFLIQSLTAYFLAVQFRFTGEPFLGALSGAFGFVAVIILVQLFTFPDVLGPFRLVQAGPQASIWVWVEWQLGFPFLVFVGLALRQVRPRRRLASVAGWLIMAAGPGGAVLIGGFTIVYSNSLPVLISHGSYSALRHSGLSLLVVAMLVGALVMCVRITRLRDLLSLWLAVALLAALANAVLTLGGPTRFTVGWYGGRILSLASASFVFCVFIFEFARLYERLVETNVGLANLAFFDALTGAFNRGYFNQQFPREVGRAMRDCTSLSILMVDIDHFKTYNDSFGHQNGDLCLVAVVQAIRDVVQRPGDFVARYGGEEFVVVLPRTPCEGAHLLALKIRQNLAALPAPSEGGPLRPVTVSAGIATLEPGAIAYGADELLRRADQALYQAKLEGRDQARIYAKAA